MKVPFPSLPFDPLDPFRKGSGSPNPLKAGLKVAGLKVAGLKVPKVEAPKPKLFWPGLSKK